jgi:uncharacterized protein (TIGR00730 family)
MSKTLKRYRVGLEWHDNKIQELTDLCATFEHRHYIQEILTTVVKMGLEKTDNVDLKLVNTALKELRYSFLKLSDYRSIKKVTVFGSARTPSDHTAYLLAEEFSRRIVEEGYMVITGAGSGIMEAGNKGSSREKSFGVNINLPFEQEANPYIDNDHKLINFNYFFTRKLIFIKESCATTVFPGGFGTMDEVFENITLFQTGKSGPRPIILMEPEGDQYWVEWENFINKSLFKQGYIGATDSHMYEICHSAEEAVDIILKFNRVYHSIRNIGRQTVLRLNYKISEQRLKSLIEEFSHLFKGQELIQREALPEEVEGSEYPDLPRLVFTFEKRDYGHLKLLIDRINESDRV